MRVQFEKLIENKKSLLEWIKDNLEDGILHKSLPEEAKAIDLSISELKNMRFMDGMLDGCLAGSENKDKLAKDLLNNILEIYQNLMLGVISSREEFDEKLGAIYTFLIKHQSISYIDDFLKLCLDEFRKDNKFGNFLFKISKDFLDKAAHVEAVKFALAVLGIFNLDEEDLKYYQIFGLSDELARFVAVALGNQERYDLMFELAQKVKGWGRVAYLDYLEIKNLDMRKWLLFEGYDCDIGVDHVVLDCLNKGDLPGYIKEYGFDVKLYDATGEMLESFCDLSRVSFGDYEHSKELVSLFIKEARNQKMSLRRFRILCDLMDYIKEEDEETKTKVFSQAEQDELMNVVENIAFHSKIDWQALVLENVLDYDARVIARTLGVDIWEKMFEIAQKDKHFDDWYALTLTHNKERYKRLCDLIEQRFDLEALKKEPKDELGMGAEFRDYTSLEFIAQNLKQFDEIIGLNIIETLLQSPVVRSRNMALNVIEKYAQIPQSTLEILRKNLNKEPNKEVIKRYQNILIKVK